MAPFLHEKMEKKLGKLIFQKERILIFSARFFVKRTHTKKLISFFFYFASLNFSWDVFVFGMAFYIDK